MGESWRCLPRLWAKVRARLAVLLVVTHLNLSLSAARGCRCPLSQASSLTSLSECASRVAEGEGRLSRTDRSGIWVLGQGLVQGFESGLGVWELRAESSVYLVEDR